MKVLHCCYRYFPDRGGSETYVSSLIRGLSEHGVENIIASAGEPPLSYQHEGVAVHRLGYPAPASETADTPPPATGYVHKLRSLVQRLRPDIIHFHWHPPGIHDWLSSPVGPGCPLILTYHHPAITCSRGDLWRFGLRPCSGLISRELCLPCAARMFGAPGLLADALAMLPDRLLTLAANSAPRGKVRTALEMGSVMTRRIENAHRFLQAFDRIIALSEWSRQMLAANGVPEARLGLSRLGTHHPSVALPSRQAKRPGESLRGVFVGRLSREKGVHILAEAMKALPDEPVTLDVYGPLDSADPELKPHIEASAKPGARLRFLGTLADGEVVNTLRDYDFAVVCSQFFETGPYTVIEAFQAGLPVLGTDIGGINEMVVHNVNGWLIPPGDIAQWVEVLRMIAHDPATLETWRSRAAWNRTMNDAAAEARQTYQTLLAEARGGIPHD